MAETGTPKGIPEIQPGLLTARRMLEWRRNTSRMDRIRVPERVILTHQVSLFRALAPQFGRGKQPGLLCDLRVLRVRHGPLGIAGNFGLGGPMTAAVIEELVEAGVREVVAVDVAASLYAEVPSGTIVLVSDAAIGDGTAPHYLPNTLEAEVSGDLSGRLASALASRDIGFTAGRVWSTDAVYRETAAEVRKYRGSDCGARRHGIGFISRRWSRVGRRHSVPARRRRHVIRRMAASLRRPPSAGLTKDCG